MIRVILYFIILCLFFGLVITNVRAMTGKEKLSLIKLLGFSIICGTLAFSTLVAIVILF